MLISLFQYYGMTKEGVVNILRFGSQEGPI